MSGERRRHERPQMDLPRRRDVVADWGEKLRAVAPPPLGHPFHLACAFPDQVLADARRLPQLDVDIGVHDRPK